jgi:hypothetical protein
MCARTYHKFHSPHNIFSLSDVHSFLVRAQYVRYREVVSISTNTHTYP